MAKPISIVVSFNYYYPSDASLVSKLGCCAIGWKNMIGNQEAWDVGTDGWMDY